MFFFLEFRVFILCPFKSKSTKIIIQSFIFFLLQLFSNLDPIDGVWTEWSAWTCGSPCGTTSVKVKSRTCTNPQPLNGGSPCVGEDFIVVDETCATGVVCPCTDTGRVACATNLHICTAPVNSYNYNLSIIHCHDSCNLCPVGKEQHVLSYFR